MIEETIDARYTLVLSVLEERLELWFGKDNFKIIVRPEARAYCLASSCVNRLQEPPDDYAKWKISIPRRLEMHEKRELRRRFAEFRKLGKSRAAEGTDGAEARQPSQSARLPTAERHAMPLQRVLLPTVPNDECGSTRRCQPEYRVNPMFATIFSSERLMLHLEGEPETLIFHVGQEDSWSHLLVTEELFRKLLTACNVHPRFLDIVHIFGEKFSATEESFNAFFGRLAPNIEGCGYEVAYNFKYVACHGRESPDGDPFSVRETGIYHNFQADPAKSTWILLNPSGILSERLALAISEPETSQPLGQFRFHPLIMSCLAEGWRDYVNHLEEKLADMMDCSFSSSLEQPINDGQITASFGVLRSLQITMDKVKRLIHLLKLNRNLCEHLKGVFSRARSLSSPSLAGSFGQFETMMDDLEFQTRTHLLQLGSIVSRAQGVGSLIEHILDLRTANTNHRMNSAMHEISKQGAEENCLVRQLTSQSTKDTRAMRTIALISAVFLPATFLAWLHWLYPQSLWRSGAAEVNEDRQIQKQQMSSQSFRTWAAILPMEVRS
ncbi:unnamed protein product [Diplocarpon coronariae]